MESDQQFVEMLVKEIVNNPNDVKTERIIDEQVCRREIWMLHRQRIIFELLERRSETFRIASEERA